MPTRMPTKPIELCGQPIAMSTAITIDRMPSNSTHPQPCLGFTLNASITLDTPLASMKAPIRRAMDAMPATGRSRRKMPSRSVRIADRIFKPKPSLPRSWIA